jgi:glycerol-3-phosphate dehydrogenase subunit B
MMKFDVVIIGGGLSGLTCGIRLAQEGRKCVIISSGQSALHFSSGSFDLLNSLPDGTRVTNPLESLSDLSLLNPTHPYVKMGKERFAALAEESKQLLEGVGIHTKGSYKKNHYRITPLAMVKSTWLTMMDFLSTDDPKTFNCKSFALFNFVGYLDFYPDYLAEKFERMGVKTQGFSIDLSSVERMRRNPSELRSTNIARLFDEEEARKNLIKILKEKAADYEVVLLPACLGLENANVISELSKAISKPVYVVATFPPSVAGIRAQYLLKQKFMRLGGMYMLGDTVNGVDIKENSINKIFTVNHGDIPIVGDDYILCSGSFFSQGLVALPDKVIDPIFGLDIDYSPNRQDWYTANVYDKQRYLTFGVETNNDFLAIKDHKTVENLHACGAILGGFDALKEGCGSGVSLLTALYVAGEILRK